jgi:hypothetical protein
MRWSASALSAVELIAWLLFELVVTLNSRTTREEIDRHHEDISHGVSFQRRDDYGVQPRTLLKALRFAARLEQPLMNMPLCPDNVILAGFSGSFTPCPLQGSKHFG